MAAFIGREEQESREPRLRVAFDGENIEAEDRLEAQGEPQDAADAEPQYYAGQVRVAGEPQQGFAPAFADFVETPLPETELEGAAGGDDGGDGGAGGKKRCRFGKVLAVIAGLLAGLAVGALIGIGIGAVIDQQKIDYGVARIADAFNMTETELFAAVDSTEHVFVPTMELEGQTYYRELPSDHAALEQIARTIDADDNEAECVSKTLGIHYDLAALSLPLYEDGAAGELMTSAD